MTEQSGEHVSDAIKGHWVETRLPAPLRPYAQLARFDRPIGWWLLLLPCWWSTALAAVAKPEASLNLFHIFLFVMGAVVMRGAGCTYNDIVDRDIDEKVARTRSRPIPSGRVSARNAVLFAILLCLVGLLVLIQFNMFTIGLGFGSLIFVAIYPFMKRITHWPQFTLGLSFSWGALMGWAASFGALDYAPVFLYAGAVFWTIGYDTIYAHQDKEDDAIVGVKSTALLFGRKTKPFLILFYSLATACFAASFYDAGAGAVSYVGLALGVLHMIYQVVRLDIDKADQCLQMFRSNRDYGLIVFIGLVLDTLV